MVTFLAAVFVFGLLIASHEFGHFITAKLAGIKVLEFAIGMGPKLIGFKTKETKYSLRILPIGGYVKMLGEEEESNDPRAFCNKSPWRRLTVIVAGAFMNFAIAVILFSLVFMNTGILKPIIGHIEPNYPAAKAGLMVGDKIVAVNNQPIKKWDEFTNFIFKNKDKAIKITVNRENKDVDFTLKPQYDSEMNKYLIGINATLVKGNILESFKEGFKKTIDTGTEIFKFLGTAIRGKISSAEVGGPIAIIQMSGQVAKMGVWNLLMFAAVLSVNLGIINLIPFPALDGGWVIILLIEGITGKKLDENKVGVINLIGFSILMALFVLITFKDISKLGNF